KFRVFGGDVDVAVASQEARQIPILVLTLPFAAPQFAANFFRRVLSQPLGAVSDPLHQVRWDASFLLQFAKRRRPRLLALVDPVLGHLTRLMRTISHRDA